MAFSIGSLDIRWYGIIIGSAILSGLILVLKEAKRKKIDTEFFLDFFIYGIPVAIICARLYYVFFRWEIYSGNLIRIFAIREGGIAIHGALIGGFIVLLFMTKKRNISLWKTLDILSPAVVLGQAIGRWGNFINQEAHGGVVSKGFISKFPGFIQRQMYINGQYYHPTFLYESLWDFGVFIILVILRHRKNIKKGDIFLTYIVGYSIGRFFIEGMRTDSLMLGTIKVAQLLSIILTVTGLSILYLRHKKTDR